MAKTNEVLQIFTGVEPDQSMVEEIWDEVVEPKLKEIDDSASGQTTIVKTTGRRFGHRDQSLITGRPHHLDPWQAKSEKPELPSRRPR